MKIGKIKIDFPVLLAPMAGFTDYPFRVLCKRMGAGLVYSEFVSADGIIRENVRTLEMIHFSDEERKRIEKERKKREKREATKLKKY